MDPWLIDSLVLTCLNSDIRLRTRLFNTFKKQVRFFRHETFFGSLSPKEICTYFIHVSKPQHL